MRAEERLWLTEKKDRLVPEGHSAAATLYAAIGDEVPDETAERFGLKDGLIKGGKKQGDGGEDKRRKGGEDKTVKPEKPEDGDKADDLTQLKGIGEASAKALVAAGIDSFAALAAIDPDNAPTVEGLGANPAWNKWVPQARELGKASA